MSQPTDRMRKLREQTFRGPMMSELPSHSWGPWRRLRLCEGLVASVGQPTTRLRRAASLAYRLEHECVAINFTFQPGGAATRESLKAVIRTLIARGGLQLQMNCVSKRTLLDARQNPDAHRDLLVRIGGYSDYFTSLPPAMQDEIVARTEHP